jgi:SAM-dependent methyltransferase
MLGVNNLINLFKKIKRNFLPRTKKIYQNFQNSMDLNNYLRSDRRPWRRGYQIYKNKYLEEKLNDAKLLEIFLKANALPKNYGYRLDARIVEIPWVFAQLNIQHESLLDAGSSLNNEVAISAPVLANKKITIVTLAPESICFWRKGISYIFGDLRDLDFKDNAFDLIVCISTIEHIGMDNSMYTKAGNLNDRVNSNDFLVAIKELKRILKTGGALFCTFPFGKYENHGWFQQFDSQLTDTLIKCFNPVKHTETIFKYDPEGWIISNREDCSDCQFFDVQMSKYFDPKSTIEYPSDFPAGERAVTCLKLIK